MHMREYFAHTNKHNITPTYVDMVFSQCIIIMLQRYNLINILMAKL